MSNFGRRRVLRGLLNGAAVTVALPMLDCFLNGNGNALADGSPLPVRFGNWSWGLGCNEKIFTPKKVGAGFELTEELQSFAPVRDQINVFTGHTVFRDAAPPMCHFTGWVVLKSGIAPMSRTDLPGETIDVSIAKVIGRTTRFQSLSATATGSIRDSYSYENKDSVIAPEWSPGNLYARIFGPDFQDPNAPTFTPNPRLMARKSVLSVVLDESKSIVSRVGAADKARIDQYFTGLRELERQFDQQLKKPDPIAICKKATEPTDEIKAGTDVDVVGLRHKLMTDLLVMAVACDQSRVINMGYASAQASTTRTDYDKPHHTTTHEEGVDPVLGYQPNHSWFVKRAMESLSYFVDAFSKVKEGDGTLLDHMLIYASSDQSNARIHAMDGIPMFTAGRAGGRVKTGIHVAGNNAPGTRLGFTVMRAMGVNISSWGTQSNGVTEEIHEILV